MGQVTTTLRVVDKGSKTLNNILKKLNAVNAGFQKMANQSAKLNSAVNSTTSANSKLTRQLNNTTNAFKKQSNSAGMLTSKLKRLASAYLGVMGARALITTSDTLTSADNKFTTFARNGGLANPAAFSAETQEKIFNAAQASYSNYADMMNNVSKSVTLAADAFGETSEQQIDNAIKFQEVMAKSYALGGASAAEQSSSMYQLVQALGSGKLSGDELRSVTEGAPLAAKAIESFAQELLHSTKSLKELGSEGLITSDVVVAAILDMEGQVDESFEHIQLTWAQLWTRFKNDAIRAFQPLMKAMRNIANNKGFQKFLDRLTDAMYVLGAAAGWVGDRINDFFSIINENEWILDAFMAALISLGIILGGTLLMQLGAFVGKFVGMVTTFVTAHPIITALAIIFGLLAYHFYTAGVTAETLRQAILLLGGALAIVGVIAAMFGLSIAGPLLIVVGIVFLLIYVFLQWGSVVGGVIAVILAWINNAALFIQNVWFGLMAVFNAICSNIIIAFANAWYEAEARFWDFVAAVMSGVNAIISKLNGLLGIFGISIDTSGFESRIESAQAKAQSARDKTQAFKDIGAAWDEGFHTNDVFQSGWAQDAYNQGSALVGGWQDAANNWIDNTIDSAKNKISGLLDGGAVANSDLSGISGIGSDVGDIASDTGKISKCMEVAEEDLELVRDIAESEAINRFTTAEIKVEMTNNNNVSEGSDLDGIVTHLSTRLREELSEVAQGVHVA